MLRVNAILRRVDSNHLANIDDEGHIIFEKDGLKADLTAYKVFIDGVQVDMAPRSMTYYSF